MKIHTILLCFSIVWVVLHHSEGNEYVFVQPSEPTTIFQPFGKIINQYTYANIRVHVNITSLFEEVNQLGYVSKFLKEGKKKMGNSSSSRKLVHMLTEDLVAACKESTRKLKDLTKTFGFTDHSITKYSPSFNQGNITRTREKGNLLLEA